MLAGRNATVILLLPLLVVSLLIVAGTAAGSLDVPIRPWPILVCAVCVGSGWAAWLGRRTGGTVVPLGAGMVVGGYVAWLAWPTLYPITAGPDLVHHLTLIHFLQARLALPTDPMFGPYLGEMTGYPPGSHLIAAIAGGVTGRDGLTLVHPIMALASGLKAALIADLLLRLLPPARWRPAAAFAGGVFLLVPHAYLLSPIVYYGFYSQVLSEVFAVALWWAFVVWRQDQRRRWLVTAALFGIALVLTWPVFLPVPALAGLAVIVERGDRAWHARALDALAAFGPVAVVVAAFAVSRRGAAGILASGGDVLTPSLAVFGIPFIVLVTAGALVCVRHPRRDVAVWSFGLAAIAQVVALVALQIRLDATNPYLGFKTMHLLVYGLAVLAALGLNAVWQRYMRHAAWGTGAVLVVLAVLLWRSDLPTRPLSSPITADVHQAGRWARAHLPPTCVDYLVPHWMTAYWLHIDTLGNARASARVTEHDPYDFRSSLARWIDDSSLRYAIVEDWHLVPSDIRARTETRAAFGRASVVERVDGFGGCWDEMPGLDAVGR